LLAVWLKGFVVAIMVVLSVGSGARERTAVVARASPTVS